MAKRARLGDCDEMFRRFFDRWYDEDARKLKDFDATRPDMMQVLEYVGQSVADLSPLTEAAASKVQAQVETMRDAAAGDWPNYLPVTLPIDVAWIDSFDAYYDWRESRICHAHLTRRTSRTSTWSSSASSERSSGQS